MTNEDLLVRIRTMEQRFVEQGTIYNDLFKSMSEDTLTLRRTTEVQLKRIAQLETTLKQTLELSLKKEQMVELTVTGLLAGVFSTISASLQDSLMRMKTQLQLENSAYVINVVDGVSEFQNEQTIVVTRKDDRYSYAKASSPELCIEEGLDIFSEYFDKHPEVFIDNTVSVNVLMANRSEVE